MQSTGMTTPIRLLLADDEDPIIEYLQEQLREELPAHSFAPEFVRASTGSEAWEIIQKNGIHFGIIDHEFRGGISGLEVIRRAKKYSVNLIGLTEHEDILPDMRREGVATFSKGEISNCVEYVVKTLQSWSKMNSNPDQSSSSQLREPYMQLRTKALWAMLIFCLLWLGWKLTGYAVLSPVWAVIGAFVGLCFFVMSFLLRIDIERHRRNQ